MEDSELARFEEDCRLDRPHFIGGRAMHCDKSGEPIGLITWNRLHCDRDYSIVGKTHMLGYSVSTVWNGIDCGWNDEGPPIIFETMIFTPLYVWCDEARYLFRQHMDFRWQYSTEAEALAGHWLASELLRAELSNRAVNGREAPKMITGGITTHESTDNP